MVTNMSFYNIFQELEISLPRPVRFWLLVILLIPSVYCSFVLIFHLFVDKNLRSQLSNHIIINLLIIGLIIELIDFPFHLSFLHLGVVKPSTPLFCQVWWFMDIGLYNGCTIIMAWGSIQRYLLIFHVGLFSTAKKRLVFHYSPLIILTLYILIFYFTVIVFPPCTNTYDYTLPVCNNFPCYLDDPLLGIWDSVMNNIVPTITITIFSVTLLIRVNLQKRRLHQTNLWRKQRKMAIQLLCNSFLYMMANIPLNICILAHLCGLPEAVGAEMQLYFDYLCYYVTLLFPFVCLGILSELRKKIKWKGVLLFRRSQRIATVNPR
jgi:hypothetical protein